MPHPRTRPRPLTHPRGLKLLIGVACMGGVLGGCSSFKPPSLTIVDVALTDSTDEAVGLAFTLDLENPNDDPIKLQEFEYRLRVEGTHVYHGRWSAEETVSRHGRAQVTIPAVIRRDDMSWDASRYPDVFEYSLSGSLVYLTPGELAQTLLDSGVRTPTMKFSSRGRVQVDGAGGLRPSDTPSGE